MPGTAAKKYEEGIFMKKIVKGILLLAAAAAVVTGCSRIGMGGAEAPTENSVYVAGDGSVRWASVETYPVSYTHLDVYKRQVYNEMKGAFSSPESVLDRFTRNVLFPDTTYSNESGGDPAVIPELTYEKFIAFHRNYYHPANSYIYLYGDMDMAQKLTWLDQEYLGQYDREDCHADSAIALQQPFEQPVQREITYSVTEEEGTKDRTCLLYTSRCV